MEDSRLREESQELAGRIVPEDRMGPQEVLEGGGKSLCGCSTGTQQLCCTRRQNLPLGR